MKVSIRFNQFLLYGSILIASLVLLVVAINIFYFDAPIKEDLNIGLIGIYLSMMVVMLSQYFEIKQKEKNSKTVQ